MPIYYDGKKYRSKKHPMLEYIFNKKTDNGKKGIGEDHLFTLSDIAEGYRACGINEPVSISNTILDLTRKNTGIASRLPDTIYEHGYDLRKRTGRSPQGNLAGEFVYVGVGKSINAWLEWPSIPDLEVVIENTVPHSIINKGLLGRDEGALFSVIDYCDVLSHAFYNKPNQVIRVQNPKKWQPNEIDGLYYSEQHDTLFPCEAKALSTGDDINLVQLLGGYKTIQSKMPHMDIIPVAVRMVINGIDIGLFEEEDEELKMYKFIKVTFDPQITAWL
ncbi:hypothetical protein [Thalassobacillus devorans]|uniref:hypothetical protein n=1 Tax=Thalassobacillus devorans TaxID=279813 RepID=UPI00049094F7|nr:hypothetical protein [Thalassobacillus devorans]